MSDIERFILLTQTGAITLNIQYGRSPYVAVQALNYAIEIADTAVPRIVEAGIPIHEAVTDYLELQYSVSPPNPPYPVPDWLVGIAPY